MSRRTPSKAHCPPGGHLKRARRLKGEGDALPSGLVAIRSRVWRATRRDRDRRASRNELGACSWLRPAAVRFVRMDSGGPMIRADHGRSWSRYGRCWDLFYAAGGGTACGARRSVAATAHDRAGRRRAKETLANPPVRLSMEQATAVGRGHVIIAITAIISR